MTSHRSLARSDRSSMSLCCARVPRRRMQDILFLDQLLAQLEAKSSVKKPIMIHAILETAEGVDNVADIAVASPRMPASDSRPADLAASRAMKTTRASAATIPTTKVSPTRPHRPFTAGWAFSRICGITTIAKMVDAPAHQPNQGVLRWIRRLR